MDLDICNTIQAAATSKENNAILGHLQAIDEEGRHWNLNWPEISTVWQPRPRQSFACVLLSNMNKEKQNVNGLVDMDFIRPDHDIRAAPGTVLKLKAQ